jgi:osmotically-inducible protein OsmY
MRNRFLFLVMLAGAPVTLWPAQAPAAAQQKTSAVDDEIFDNVRRRLANDPDVRGGALQVDVKDGVVTLKGKVEKDRYKQKAEKLAKKVKGVKSVVNQLIVDQRTL